MIKLQFSRDTLNMMLKHIIEEMDNKRYEEKLKDLLQAIESYLNPLIVYTNK